MHVGASLQVALPHQPAQRVANASVDQLRPPERQPLHRQAFSNRSRPWSSSPAMVRSRRRHTEQRRTWRTKNTLSRMSPTVQLVLGPCKTITPRLHAARRLCRPAAAHKEGAGQQQRRTTTLLSVCTTKLSSASRRTSDVHTSARRRANLTIRHAFGAHIKRTRGSTAHAVGEHMYHCNFVVHMCSHKCMAPYQRKVSNKIAGPLEHMS